MINIKEILQGNVGEEVDVFGIVKGLREGNTVNGDSYLDLILSDNTGDVEVKIWDFSLETIQIVLPLENGLGVKVRGKVGEWKDKKQITVLSKKDNLLIRSIIDKDPVNPEDLIKSSPIDIDKMFSYIVDTIKSMENESIKEICLTLYLDNEDKIKIFPSAKHIHHEYRGGFLHHTYSMLVQSKVQKEIYPEIDEDLLFAGIILHDIGKLREISVNEIGIYEEYTREGELFGHLYLGAEMISHICRDKKIDESSNKVNLLKHICLSHHGREDWGAFKKPLFLEAEIVANLDLTDSSLNQISKTTELLEKDEFSEPQYFLEGRRILKHN